MQKYTSKDTAIVHKTVPYIVNHIDWQQFKGGRCLDYGSGRPNPDTHYKIHKEGIQYYPYDPYWVDEWENKKAMNLYPTIVICSNLLNVIDDDWEVKRIHDYIRGLKVPYFIKIYEGDRSGVGKETRKDCWQRNQTVNQYKYEDEIVYKGIITMPKYKNFII